MPEALSGITTNRLVKHFPSAHGMPSAVPGTRLVEDCPALRD